MKILKNVLSLPTAPFHEEYVSDYVKGFCKSLKVPFKVDRYGNILAHYKSGKAKQPVALTSHMDHPGFQVITGGTGKCVVGILGGVDLNFFAGAKVLIKTEDGVMKGVVAKKPLKQKWHKKPLFEVKIKGSVKKGDFGWYDLVPFKLEKDIIHTKAADNLVSTASLLELLFNLKKKRVTADVRCLFTRAEEVGFVGCVAFAENGNIPQNVPVIVLECSSAKAAKVVIGGGPVIRVGDKLTTYSSEVDYWLKSAAEGLIKRNKKFKYQRALLSGGTCEASVWSLKKRLTGGLAFPLGNYHNNAEKGYAPEFVSMLDYELMQDLLLELVKADRLAKKFAKAGAAIYKNFKAWKGLL